MDRQQENGKRDDDEDQQSNGTLLLQCRTSARATTSIQNDSNIADKPRDAFVQLGRAHLGWKRG